MTPDDLLTRKASTYHKLLWDVGSAQEKSKWTIHCKRLSKRNPGAAAHGGGEEAVACY
jgi:hypothetical protein